MAEAVRHMGALISIEGPDGAGKSTQIRLLASALREAGHEVVETREPGGSEGAEEIRRLLVEGAPGRWSAETEMLLFTAARRDHLERVIEPALARGAFVVTDRFADSTRAYQGVGGSARRETVDALHRLMIGREPDLTLMLDIAPETALARSSGPARGEDRFELKGLAFQTALRAAFLEIAAAEPARCAVIDASADPETVADEIRRTVTRRLGVW